jgi:hypothetical protein
VEQYIERRLHKLTAVLKLPRLFQHLHSNTLMIS